MMKQWTHQDTPPSAQASTGKRTADGINTVDDHDVEDASLAMTESPNSPELRKRADPKTTQKKKAPTRHYDEDPQPSSPIATPISSPSQGAYTQSPRPWTPDSVSTVYPDNPRHPLHTAGEEPSDNEHEDDTPMPSPRFSPYRKSQSGEFEEDDITPTQLEDIYRQHDNESSRVTDSSQLSVDPRTETGEVPQSPTPGDKPQPTQAKPVEEVDHQGKNEGC
jgi:hypothetical protein